MKVEGRRRSLRLKWVSELINHENRTWREELVRYLFWQHDANCILGIKLVPRAQDDFMAWSGESNGIFSVRSAYRIGMQDGLDKLSQGQSSAQALGDRKIWNLIWKAHVPQKLHVFAWKTATNSLGVLTNGHQRITRLSPICGICGREEEDAHHALVRCTLARALRDEVRSHWTLPPDDLFANNEPEWLFQLLGNSSKDIQTKIIFLLWRT
jgi:hypothetical protein